MQQKFLDAKLQKTLTNYILIGFKLCGKSTFGRLISKKCKYHFIDTDILIEENYNQKHATRLNYREIAQEAGLEEFRSIEQHVIRNLSLSTPSIIATGGGVITAHENIIFLKRLGKVIYIKTPLDIIERRLAKLDSSFIPARACNMPFNKFFQKRHAIYTKISDYIVDIENECIEENLHKLSLIIPNLTS